MDWGEVLGYVATFARAAFMGILFTAFVGVCGYAWGRGWTRGVARQVRDERFDIVINEKHAGGEEKRIIESRVK